MTDLSPAIVLIATSAVCSACLLVAVVWSLKQAAYIGHVFSPARSIFPSIISISISLFTQSTNLAFITYLHESGYSNFFVASCVSFSLHRVVTSLSAGVYSYSAIPLNLVFDFDLYRSLLMHYLLGVNEHQTRLISIQVAFSTSFQCVFALLLLVEGETSFVVWLFLLSSSLNLIINAIHRYSVASILFVLDMYAQICMFALMYALWSFTVAYIVVFIAFCIVSCLQLSRVHDNNNNIDNPYITYDPIKRQLAHTQLTEFLTIVSIIFKIVAMIVITVGYARNVDAGGDTALLVMIIVAWIAFAVIPCVVCGLMYKDCCDIASVCFDGVGDAEQSQFESRFYASSIAEVQQILVHFFVEKQLLLAQKLDQLQERVLLIGDVFHAKYDVAEVIVPACTCFRQLEANYVRNNDRDGDGATLRSSVYEYSIFPQYICDIIVHYVDNMTMCGGDQSVHEMQVEIKGADMRARLRFLHFHDIDEVRKPFFVRKLFETVRAIVYCVDLSVYDMTDEDGVTNLLQASLDAFDRVTGLSQFQTMPFILILTGADEFAQKIAHRPLTLVFPQWNLVDDSYDAAIDCIRDQYQYSMRNGHTQPARRKGLRGNDLRNGNRNGLRHSNRNGLRNGQLYVHTANDSDRMVECIVDDVQHIIIGSCLDLAGLM